MHAAAGWCGDNLCTPFKARSQLTSNALAARRDSLDLGRASFEAPTVERAVSCSALPEVRLVRGSRQQKGQRGQIIAATAVAIRELAQENTAPSDQAALQEWDLSDHQKEQVEQDRVRLELAWNRRRNEAEEQRQGEEQSGQDSLPQEDTASVSPEQQRALLVAKWQENKQALPEQKRQNAASRRHSSRRARRRSQPLVTSKAQRIRAQQNLGAQHSQATTCSAVTLSPDEQLLESLRMQLPGARSSGGAVHGFTDLQDVPVLTKQQESGLATMIRSGYLLGQAQDRLRDELGRSPSPEELGAETGRLPEEFSKAIDLAAEGKRLMMQYNLRLVYSICRQHVNRGLDLEDMLPEGVLGLEKAIDKFEPAKGFRFSTYGHWWIRQHVHRALVESRIIRLPVNVVDNIARITSARRKLGEQKNRRGKVTDEELSSVLGLPLAKVKLLTQLSQPIKSLDVPLWQGDEDCLEALHESISTDKGTGSEEDSLAAEALDMVEDDMTALLQTLPVRERNVIRWRYGLWPDGKSMGLHEVGVAYGLTQERIRQIEESGLARLRERSPAHFKKWVPS